MQAADFLAMLSIAPAQAQGQARGLDAAAGLGGLFGSAEGGFGLDAALAGDAGFAEALLAVLAVAQPQQPQGVAPTPKGEAADTVLDGAPGRNFVPTLLAQAQVPAAAQGVDASAVVAAPVLAFDTAETAAAPPSAIASVPAADPQPGSFSDDAANTGVGPAKAPETLVAPAAPAAPLAKAFGALPAAAPAAPTGPAPAPVVLANGLTVTPLPDQPPAAATAPVAPAAPEAVAPPPLAAAAAPVVQARVPAAAKPQPAQAKAETPAPAPEAKAAALPAAPTVAKAEETLTETAVAAAAPVEAEDAPPTDKPPPALPPVPAHAEARGLAQAPAFEAPRATPQTVAVLSAQIAKSLEGGKSTRFEVQLEPAGLGKVEVRVEIRPSGDIKADLSFESPVAAAELRARSGELQTALERAGFDSSKTQLSFNTGGQQGFGGSQFAEGFWRDQQQQQQHQSQSWRGAAFMDLADAPQNPAAAYYGRERDGGVDVRI